MLSASSFPLYYFRVSTTPSGSFREAVLYIHKGNIATDSPSNMEVHLREVIHDMCERGILSDTAHDPSNRTIQGGIGGRVVVVNARALLDFLKEEGD